MKHSVFPGLFSKIIAVLALLAIVSYNAQAQRTLITGGTYTIDNTGTNTGTNFVSFTDAINDININSTFTGTVVFDVAAGQTFTENTPAITATGTSSASIIFQKSGPGNNPVILSSGSTSKTDDAGITIKGSDYLIFNGIDITATDSSLEFGYVVNGRRESF